MVRHSPRLFVSSWEIEAGIRSQELQNERVGRASSHVLGFPVFARLKNSAPFLADSITRSLVICAGGLFHSATPELLQLLTPASLYCEFVDALL